MDLFPRDVSVSTKVCFGTSIAGESIALHHKHIVVKDSNEAEVLAILEALRISHRLF